MYYHYMSFILMNNLVQTKKKVIKNTHEMPFKNVICISPCHI